MTALPRVFVPALRLDVTPIDRDETLEVVNRLMADREQPHFVAGHNLHSAYLMHVDQELRRFYDDCHVVLVDGYPVLRAARRARPDLTAARHRVGSTDWLPLLDRLPPGCTIGVLGAGTASNRLAVEALSRIHGTARVVGLPGEPWDEAREAAALAWLRDIRPDVVLVGLGMPRQESFLARRKRDLPPAVYATVGGAIDQLSGVQRGAPRWLGRWGLEWAWRLATQPRRLAHRYLVEPFLLLRLVRRAR